MAVAECRGRFRPEVTIDVTVVITNYNTGPYLERCVASMFAQDVGGLSLEVVAVENASFVDQEPHLRAVAAQGARVLRQNENLGHGRGCNRGLAASTGRFVFLANSDTVARPGALAALLECLQADPRIGFVEPRTFIDDDLTFAIHEVTPPSPWATTRTFLSHWSRRLTLRESLAHTRRSLRGWQAAAPLALPHLTGAFLGARREVLQRLGGYDEGYPLFYEDSDLFRRARRLQLRLLLVPQAAVVHYGHRSVAQTWNESLAKARVGRDRYVRSHHGLVARAWDAGLHWAARLAPRATSPPPVPHDLGTLGSPPVFAPANARAPWLLELTIDPTFALTAGHVCTGPQLAVSARTWQSLFPTTYYVRAVDLGTWRVTDAWRFVRSP